MLRERRCIGTLRVDGAKEVNQSVGEIVPRTIVHESRIVRVSGIRRHQLVERP